MEVIYRQQRDCSTMKLKDVKKSLGDIERLINNHVSSSEANDLKIKAKESRIRRFINFIKSFFKSKVD